MRKCACSGPVAALIVLLAMDAGCASRANPLTVVSVRERRAEEVPFEETSRYLWPSPDANNVPGPDSLVARVRSDEKLHSYIEIEDLRTGRTVLLLRGNAFLPHWSPDGRYIACAVWKSPRQNGELTIVDVDTRTVLIDPEVRASGETAKWSPDSRIVAVDGIIYARPLSMLYTISVPEGRVTVVDTVDVLAAHEFSWSPDGHWIAFSRPTAIDDFEEVTAADLWIADAKTGAARLVLETPDWVESNPLWITNRTIQVDRVHWDGTERGVEQRVVIELSKEESDRTQK